MDACPFACGWCCLFRSAREEEDMSRVLPVAEAARLRRKPHEKTLAKAAPVRSVVIYAMNYAPELIGVGRYTTDIAEHMAKAGTAVTVVTAQPHYPSWSIQQGYANGYSVASENAVRIFRTPLVLRRKMRGIWRLVAPLTFAVASAPVAVWQILRQRPQSVLLVEPTLFAAPLAQLAARLVGARIVLHVQDLEVDAAFAVGHLADRPLPRFLANAFERFVLRRCDRVVTIADCMADKLAAKGVPAHKLAVVRNWVDSETIFPLPHASPYRSELGIAGDDFIVLYCGNIGAKQGLSVLLDAAELLRSQARVRFVIAGDGPERAELVRRSTVLGNVMMLPLQPAERFNDFLNLADLHVLPQRLQAADLVLPSKIGALLSTGRPIVATTPEGTELARFLRGAADFTPPGDASALADAILRAAAGEHGRCEALQALGATLHRSRVLPRFMEAVRV
jgi:colanic acid biosynthesis glycosyl transferase WcaI